MIVELDGWEAGSNLSSPDVRARLATALERSPLIVEHRHYRGSSAPTRLVFDDVEALDTYLASQVSPGDSFWIWEYDTTCRADNVLVCEKSPDSKGRVPRGGAY
jgi:hypothetical protein